jgi:acyl-CoA synthetase (AMP-forming)/AMP-acid ligase II
MDISQRIADVMAIDESAPALYRKGTWWTWGDCQRFGDNLEHSFADRLPLVPGTPIAVVMRNRPQHVATILHILKRRYCLVPISSIQSPERIAEDLRGQRPPIILADAEDWANPVLVDAARDCGALAMQIGSDGIEQVVTSSFDPAEQLREGTAVWMPTSGTTGPPKRIAITYRDLSIGFDRVRKYARANERAAGTLRLSTGVVISCTPLVHIAGLWEVFQFAVEGRRLILLDRFEPHSWSDAVEQHKPVVTMLPPATLTMLLDANIEPSKLASLRAILCGTAALSPDVEERFTARFGINVLSTYGATEFPGGLAGWSLEDKRTFGEQKRGSVGRPRPGIALRIVDRDTGQAVPAGTEGLIEVSSAQTKARGIQGWVRTTDLGRFDGDGFLWITGRADGAINRGGFKVLPEAVESVLLQHPSVRAVGVVGIPDARLGHVPMAGVELRSPASEEDLLAWAKERLLKYQVPARIVSFETLPRTPSMKVSRPSLIELLAAQAPGAKEPHQTAEKADTQ